MLPVWVLMPAQVVHSVSHYVISTVVRTVWLQVLKATHREYQRLTVRPLLTSVRFSISGVEGAVSRDLQLANLPGLSQYQSQAAALAGHFVGKEEFDESYSPQLLNSFQLMFSSSR